MDSYFSRLGAHGGYLFQQTWPRFAEKTVILKNCNLKKRKIFKSQDPSCYKYSTTIILRKQSSVCFSHSSNSVYPWKQVSQADKRLVRFFKKTFLSRGETVWSRWHLQIVLHFPFIRGWGIQTYLGKSDSILEVLFILGIIRTRLLTSYWFPWETR